MAIIVIRLHPAEPVEGDDFAPYLDGLVIEAFDLSVQDSQVGISLGTATYVAPVPGPGGPMPWIPNPATAIVQHYLPPIPPFVPRPLAVATAAIVVNPPAGHPEHRTSDVRLKITRGGKEILNAQLYFNVDVEPGGLPQNRLELTTITAISLYLGLPDPGREIDPADGYITVTADGTPPRYDLLRAAVELVLGHDPGAGNPPQLADLTPRQARHVAYEIVWNHKYRPLPGPQKRNLGQMYTLPEDDDDASARGQFQGDLQAYYATGDADADRLAGFVLALSASVHAERLSAAASQTGFLIPVMPNESDTESRFKSVRVILAGSEQPTVPPTPLTTPFTVPAAYLYALGATVPPQIDRDERYQLVTLAEEDHTRRALSTAITAGVLLADAAGNVVIDGVNPFQAARRLRSLGAVQGIAPIFDLNGPEPDRVAVRALVTAWLAYPGDDILTFWRNTLPPPPAPITAEITGHFELLLRPLTDGHQPLITAIENRPAQRVEDVDQLTTKQWRDLFGDPIDETLLPRFTQPGSPADRVSAFVRHVRRFFAVGDTGGDTTTLPAGGPPRLRISPADPIAEFARQYRTAAGADFVFGGTWDAGLAANAVAAVFPPDDRPAEHDWLTQSVRVIDELTRLSAGVGIPAEVRSSIVEALYARGITGRDQAGRLTADQLRDTLAGTVAYEYAEAIRANATGTPPEPDTPDSGFVPVNPDDCLVNCVPPDHLSPLGPVAYLHDLLRLTGGWTCAGAPPDDQRPTLRELVAERRGPVGDMLVTPANLAITLPMTDLVNECLEAVAADPAHPVGAVYDTGDNPAELLAAVPEHSSPATPVARPDGYAALATDFTAPGLPYDQPLDINRSYLAQLGTSRYDVMRRFRRDITEFVIMPDAEPVDFQRHLWRFPVRVDIAREYLGISADEHRLLLGDGDLPLRDIYGFPAKTPSWTRIVARLPEFLRRTGLTYCEFLGLWRCGFVPFGRSGDDPAFPDCEPCHLDDYVIDFGVHRTTGPLLKLAVFIRLWRKARYSFDQLRDICEAFGLFTADGAVDPDFVRQFAAFQMLRDSFGIALTDPANPPADGAIGADRTHLLALWAGPGAAKWPWALDELLDQVQAYARVAHRCRARTAEFRELLSDNLDTLAALAGLEPGGWLEKPTHTLRFAELLAKIHASDFTVDELLFVCTTADRPGGDDPFPLQPGNEALGAPLDLPDDDVDHSLAVLRAALLGARVTDEDTNHWTWHRVARAMRGRFGYAPAPGADPLHELAEHFFPHALHTHHHHVPTERRQFRTDLPGTAEAMWNTPDGPFRYDETAGQLWTELPVTDEAVIAKLSRIRQLGPAEIQAVRELYFAPRAALAPFSFLFTDLAEAERRLIEEPDEHERWKWFRHQFALCHRRADLIAEHLARHVAAVTGRAGEDTEGMAEVILRTLHGDENHAVDPWENDSGAAPAVTWPMPTGGAWAALLALTGTGLLGEFTVGPDLVWREMRGPAAAFGGAGDAANVAVPTVLPALDLPAGPADVARTANGMLFALPDGAALGGGQAFTATWSGVLLVDEGGNYEFHASEPLHDDDRPRWRVVLQRGHRHWVLLGRHWPDENAPAWHSGPVPLRSGAYDLTIEFVQPAATGPDAEDVRPARGGFRLEYEGPDTGGDRDIIPRSRLFRPYADSTLADGIEDLDGTALTALAARYTGSLRDIRRTYQRAFQALLIAHRFGLSARPVADDGRSEIEYLLAHPAEFAGRSYHRDGDGWTTHRAGLDLDLQPVFDKYHPPARDLRAGPTLRRQQALFDRWERIFDYTTVRAETAKAPEPPLWLLFHENAERHPDVAATLRRHMGMDARHVPLVLAYDTGVILTGDDLLDERWTTRVWRAERWLRALERAFPVADVAAARPDLWAADDPAPGNADLTGLVRDSYLGHGEPLRYGDLTRLNDGLRARAQAALLAYLCGMDRVRLPGGATVRDPKQFGDQLLIDLADGNCRQITRVDEAIGAVQLFVRRARLGLEPEFPVSSAFALLWDRCYADFGAWREDQQRRLYQENWVDWSELAEAQRSEAFTFFEAELRRATLTVPVAGGLEYWPEPAPPGHPGQLVLQVRDSSRIQGVDPAYHGFGLLGTPEAAGRPTWLSALTAPTGELEPGGDGEGNGDGDGGPVIELRAARAATEDERLPLWIRAAADLGTTFLRVAAAGEPPASTAFGPHDTGCAAAPTTPIDEYYFWLIGTQEYTTPAADAGRDGPDQDPDRPWHDSAELPGLLAWEPRAGVRLAWARVHNGDFGEMRTSPETLRIDGTDPQLILSGRTCDSLRFEVSGAAVPTGYRDPTAPGFRYDLATDAAIALPTATSAPGRTLLTAAVGAGATNMTVDSAAGFPDALPFPLIIGFGQAQEETVEVTAIADGTKLTVSATAAAHNAGTAVRYAELYPGGLPAYPYFVYFAPGAPVLPLSTYALAVTAAAALRAHCQPEAALRWYELAFAPLRSDSSWLRAEAEGGCAHDSTVASEDDVRNRAIVLHYVESLIELGDQRSAGNTDEARLIYDTVATLLGRAPRTVLGTGDTEDRTVATFEPHHAPLNPRLLRLYERVADRLARIHDCPPTGPCRECARSPYRFLFLQPKALELTNELRTMGTALQTAFERGDAEILQTLQGEHELNLLQLTTEVRRQQWREADWQVQALRKSKEITQTRLRHLTLLIQNGLSNREDEHVGLINTALGERTAGNVSEGIAQLMNAIPDIFAGFPVTQTWIPLGTKLSGVFMAVARIANVLAEISTSTGGLRLTQAGWERREEEWRHEVEVHGLEMEQIELQILGAERLLDIASHDLRSQEIQVADSRTKQRFLRSKFTGQELYFFNQQEISAVYRQFYELAARVAEQVQWAFNYECGHTSARFLPVDPWDHLREGLSAGDRLALALRRMEHAYLDAHHREYELSKHISLRLDFPMEFLRLQATGVCEIDIPEWMYDADFPGHYMRRHRSVSLTIPATVGPLTGVHCRLTQISSTTRIAAHLADPPHGCCGDDSPCNGYSPTGPSDPRFVTEYGACEGIATSSGQNDSGLFELNFRDEMKLPFEFTGTTCRWRLEMPPENNNFDSGTIPDVIMHVNYTAREGGPGLRRAATEIAQRHMPGDGVRYFDVAQDLPDAWYRLRYDESGAELPLPFVRTMFPYLAGPGPLTVSGMAVFVEARHAPGAHFRAEFAAHRRHPGRRRPFTCRTSSDYPRLYWGVVSFDEPVEVAGGQREAGVLRFPSGVRDIARVLLFCRYQNGQARPARHERTPSAPGLRPEW